MQLKIVCVLDLLSFASLRSEWDRLACESKSHSQSVTYDCGELAAASVFAKGQKIYVVKIYDDRGLALLWPIAVQRKGFVRIARDLRGSSDEEYGGPLMRASAGAEILRASVELLTQIKADVFEFAWVDDGSELHKVIEAFIQPWIVRHAPRRIRAAPGSEGMPRHAIKFAGFASWHDFMATRPWTVHRNHDNQLRKLLKEQENVEFGCCTSADDAENILKWLFANKRSSAEAQGITTSYLMTLELRDSFIAMMRRADLGVPALVTYIKVAGKPIAASFSLVGPDVVEFFMTAYATEFSRYSAGILLLSYTAQWAHENGRDFDMRYLHVDDKAQWANHIAVCRRHAVFLTKDSVSASVTLAGLAGRKLYESGLRRLREPIRRAPPGAQVVLTGMRARQIERLGR